MSRSLLRTALELRSPITRLPPTFLLPSRSRWLSSTSTTEQSLPTAGAPPPPSLNVSRAQQTSAPIRAKSAPTAASSEVPVVPVQYNGKPRHISRAPLAGAAPQSNTPRMPPTSPPPPPKGPIPETVKQLLPLLRTQPSHYITVHIHGRPYLVTPGDSVRLPFLMPGVSPGDVLRLNRASVLGSRDFTLRPTQPAMRRGGANEVAYIDERVYECRATVVGVESEPMRMKEKTKRRNRKVKTVKSKLRYTVVRISELTIKSPEELEE
ncbi:hypothetical protein N0V93_001015 [Gnomoniopsis smithogilvyi]|uniref:Large ribosomal subunit protein bL21m n=1 Tax=Gnomoniopsis smithogilvyi TaxID=1191159 RepID=A0A9W8Z2Y2_9PEZI|nr:hypothetical protein N0V93_001015 [Gnomoniopsis smithogilvyi]